LGFGNEDSAVIDDIVSLGKNMGLEVKYEVGLKQSRVVPRDRKKKKDPLPNNNISLPHHLPLTPSTLLHTTFHLRRQLSSTPLSTYAVNSPPHHLPLTPSTLLHTTFHLRRQLSSTPPSISAVNSPPYRYGKTKSSFRLYLICLVVCLSFFCDRFNGFH